MSAIWHYRAPCAAAYAPDSDGGTVCIACCARGLVQYIAKAMRIADLAAA